MSPRAVVALVVAALFLAPGSAEAAQPQISVGNGHACAADTRGSAFCWGDNTGGQLGNGVIGALARFDVTGLAGATGAAAGLRHVCAITASRGVKCWGLNEAGQLGVSSIPLSTTPIDVPGLADILQLALGGAFSCALDGSGSVRCWGSNANGQLGNGSAGDNATPVVVPLGARATSIAAGDAHACALLAGNTVRCWGLNGNGQVGDGTTLSRALPVDVALSGAATRIAAGGNHTCALLQAGPLMCWGSNVHGEIGDGTMLDRPAPVAVAALNVQVTSMALPAFGTCVLTAGAGVKCWGQKETLGVVYPDSDNPAPNDVSLPGPVQRIDAGVAQVCAIVAGAASCWGTNEWGQLGNDYTNRGSPTPVLGIGESITLTAIGRSHACALLSASMTIKCWGNARDGVLGNETAQFYNVAATVSGLGTVLQIVAGHRHSCALTASGGVKCWGANELGDLGDGTTNDRGTPADVSGLSSGVTQIAAGWRSCALLADGSVQCWGYGIPTPVATPGLGGPAKSIGAGFGHACAIMSSGNVKCWGVNDHGQLGNGTTVDSGIAVDVQGLTEPMTKVVGGRNHTCALSASGRVMCWGANDVGQLGRPGGVGSNVAVTVPLPTTARSLAASNEAACAAMGDGAFRCWGQVGGTTPSVATGFATGAIDGGVGNDFECAIVQDGGVNCAGTNQEAELGEGTRIFQRYSARSVVGSGGSAFLDLTPDDGLAASRASPLLTVTRFSGTRLTVDMQFGANAGKVGKIYVFALAPASLVAKARAGKSVHATPVDAEPGDGASGCVLAQVDPVTGQLQQASASALQPYFDGVLSQQGKTVTLLDNLTGRASGSTVYVGAGTSSGSMFTDGTNSAVVDLGTPQCRSAESIASSYEGLWLNSAEAGWGVNITHQGTTLFATWFTYDTDGSGMWLVMSNGTQASPGNFGGTLYRTVGPAFSATPFSSISFPANYTAVGTLGFSFADANTGTMAYTVNGVSQSKAITRFVFGSSGSNCVLGGNPGSSPNYQDLWLRDAAGVNEAGWGINIAHQGDVLFATWFTYLPGTGSTNKGMWVVMSNGNKISNGVYRGSLQTTTGPAFSSVPFNPNNVARTTVGTGTFTFTDGNNGTFSYTVNGVSQSKPIARFIYANPSTVCQ